MLTARDTANRQPRFQLKYEDREMALEIRPPDCAMTQGASASTSGLDQEVAEMVINVLNRPMEILAAALQESQVSPSGPAGWRLRPPA